MKTDRYAFTVGARYALRDYNDPSKSKTAGNLKIAYIPSLDGNVSRYGQQHPDVRPWQEHRGQGQGIHTAN